MYNFQKNDEILSPPIKSLIVKYIIIPLNLPAKKRFMLYLLFS